MVVLHADYVVWFIIYDQQRKFISTTLDVADALYLLLVAPKDDPQVLPPVGVAYQLCGTSGVSSPEESPNYQLEAPRI